MVASRDVRVSYPHCAPNALGPSSSRAGSISRAMALCFVCHETRRGDAAQLVCSTCSATAHADCLGQYLVFRGLCGACPICRQPLAHDALVPAITVALHKSEEINGPVHESTVRLKAGLAIALSEVGRLQCAEALLCELMSDRRDLSPSMQQLVEIELADVHLSMGKHHEARRSLTRLVSEMERSRGAQCAQLVVQACALAAGCLGKQREYKRAWRYMGLAYNVSVNTSLPLHVYLWERIAELHATEGNAASAIRFRQLVVNKLMRESGEQTSTFRLAFAELALAKERGGCPEALRYVQGAADRLKSCTARNRPAREALARVNECLRRMAAPARRIVGKRKLCELHLRERKRPSLANQASA